MVGRWDTSTTNPVYLKPQENLLYGRPFGICISHDRFQGGKAEATVSLSKADTGGVHPQASAQPLFGFRSPSDEYLAVGLGGYGSAYSMLRFTRGFWFALAAVGTPENLTPEQPYIISVRMQGQRVTLEVDGVQVLEHELETPPPQGQLGLYTWGPSKVEFKDASIIKEAGKVFVIMPFSDYYYK
jgi:hypothetical protein